MFSHLQHRRRRFRTVTSAPTFSNPYSTEFDGVNERVSFGALSGLVGAAEYSIAMWVKLIAYPLSFQRLWSDAGGYMYLEAADSLGTGNIRFDHFGGGRSNTVNVSLNTWTRLTVTKKTGFKTFLYKNGVTGTHANSNSVNTGDISGTFTLGGISIAGYNTNIRVNMLEFYNVYLTSANELALYNNGRPLDARTSSVSANLTHYYRMGNGDTYPTITDRVGVRNGTMTNMEAGDFVLDAP